LVRSYAAIAAIDWPSLSTARSFAGNWRGSFKTVPDLVQVWLSAAAQAVKPMPDRITGWAESLLMHLRLPELVFTLK
jgi:hypothetical protein